MITGAFLIGLILGLYIGFRVGDWFGRKTGVFKKGKDKFRSTKNAVKGGAFSRVGEYLATKPIEWIMGGKPKDKRKKPNDKERK